MKKNFQVNLSGVINILSNHLYSSSDVFVRELLQNAHDAINAGLLLEEFDPSVQVELVDDENGGVLIITDNGSGLTQDEIELFLSSVGSSIKTGNESKKTDFIGRFGVGLLSCFMVCEEINLITKSRKNHEAYQWVGSGDGSYSVSKLEQETHSFGTKVFIRFKESYHLHYTGAKIKKLIKEYADYLQHPITFTYNESTEVVNKQNFPWEEETEFIQKKERAILNASKHTFLVDAEDYIDLTIPEIGIEGVAYILPKETSRMKPQQQVYLKRMWLSNSSDQLLLPSWAFFLNCIVNSSQLSPTASRESFYDNAVLKKTKAFLRQHLMDYFKTLSEEDPEKMIRIIHTHYTAFKSLAIAESDGFSIAGGGDTLAAVDKYGIADKVSYISTGGGAFLEYVEGKTLPAVAILELRANN